MVFELCEAMYDQQTVAVRGESRWEGFGLARGQDGRDYAIFGPAQSMACVPMLALARAAEDTRWHEPSPRWLGPSPSFYVGDGLERFVMRKPAAEPQAHAERAVASLLNPLVGAASGVVFWKIARSLGSHALTASLVTVLFVAGSPSWWYAGTFFSEPLATLLLLISFWASLASSPRASFAGGLALGAAIATHITALLAVPFLAGWALSRAPSRPRAAAWLALGLALPLIALGAYNQARFGSPLETGRFADAQAAIAFGYGHAVLPWRGLYGLLLGAGKGLLLYAPVVLLGLWAWPALHRRLPALSWMIGGMAVVRIAFVASRSDWHGGFCLGPRLLVLLVPFLILALIPWLDERLHTNERQTTRWMAAITALCIAEQALFVVGEPFTFYQKIRLSAVAEGADVFAGDRIYLDWDYSPLLHLLGGGLPRGSWLLRAVPMSDWATWVTLTASLVAAWLGLLWLLTRPAARATDTRALPPAERCLR